MVIYIAVIDRREECSHLSGKRAWSLANEVLIWVFEPACSSIHQHLVHLPNTTPCLGHCVLHAYKHIAICQNPAQMSQPSLSGLAAMKMSLLSLVRCSSFISQPCFYFFHSTHHILLYVVIQCIYVLFY